MSILQKDLALCLPLLETAPTATLFFFSAWNGGPKSYDSTETLVLYITLVCFGRACAPVCCAHPSFWAHKHAKQALCIPAHRSFAAPPKIFKNKLFPETKCFPSGPNSGRQGRISFHWAKLHPTELHCALLSYDAPS